MISIALATYNGERFLKEQIDSIIAQSVSNWELVISDDGSTDSTVEIIDSYKQKDSRIRFIKNAGRHGCAENFQNALSHCSGEYIAFCDQDDVWEADHLEHLYSILGDKSVAFANSEAVDSELKSLNFFWGEKFLITEKHLSDKLFLHLIFLNFMQGTAILFKRDLLNFLPFPNALFHDHWAAISAVLKDGIAYSTKSILKYRQHESNTCGVMNRSFMYKLQALQSEGRRRIDYFFAVSDFVDKHSENFTNEKKIYAADCLEIARKILFERNFFVFKKYYDVIFWDSNHKKLFTRYIMYCILFPLFRKCKK